MTNLDKIIEYLHYHQGANRRELMDMLNLGVKDTQMKALLSEGIAKGDIRVEGKALLALLLIAYIQPFTDGNKRTSRLMANSLLISRSLCPLSFRTVEANDYRAALLLFYEQNNISAFKKMFLEQIEFAMKEYF